MPVNGNAVDYVNRFTRNPVPPLIVWNLETRADSRKLNSFYWLSADTSVNKGTIMAASPEENQFTVTPEGLNGDFSILVNPMMTDVSRPIRITTPEGTFLVRVNPSMEMLQSSLRLTGDPSQIWAAEISYRDLIGGKLQPYAEKTADIPQPADLPQPADVPQPADQPQTADFPQPADQPQSADLPQPADLPQTADQPQSADLPQPADLPQTADLSQTEDLPQTGDSWPLAGWIPAAGIAASVMLGLHFLKRLTKTER